MDGIDSHGAGIQHEGIQLLRIIRLLHTGCWEQMLFALILRLIVYPGRQWSPYHAKKEQA